MDAGGGPLVAPPDGPVPCVAALTAGAADAPDERGEGAGAGAVPGTLVAPPGRSAGAGATTIPTDVGPATVTTTVCLTPFRLAVIVAVPGLSPVTFPCASTITTGALLDNHCT